MDPLGRHPRTEDDVPTPRVCKSPITASASISPKAPDRMNTRQPRKCENGREFHFTRTLDVSVKSNLYKTEIDYWQSVNKNSAPNGFTSVGYLFITFKGVGDDGVIERLRRHVSLSADFMIGTHIDSVRGFDVHHCQTQIGDATFTVRLRRKWGTIYEIERNGLLTSQPTTDRSVIYPDIPSPRHTINNEKPIPLQSSTIMPSWCMSAISIRHLHARRSFIPS